MLVRGVASVSAAHRHLRSDRSIRSPAGWIPGCRHERGLLACPRRGMLIDAVLDDGRVPGVPLGAVGGISPSEPRVFVAGSLLPGGRARCHLPLWDVCAPRWMRARSFWWFGTECEMKISLSSLESQNIVTAC